MTLKFTTLSENTVSQMGLLGEWGLSILVETDECKVLLDTGRGKSAAYNADVLGIDFAGVDNIVISHGHLDHTGGLADVLSKTGAIEIIAHPDIWTSKASVAKGCDLRKVGIPFAKEDLEAMGASFVLSEKPVWITEHVVTTGEIPMLTDFESIDDNLCVEKDGNIVPDPLLDDRGLIVKTELGLVLFSGCAHRGIVNMLHHAKAVAGEDRVFAVIGGTHLIHSSAERVAKTVAAFREMGIIMIGVSHCTGQWASAILAHEFGAEQFFFNNAGTHMVLI